MTTRPVPRATGGVSLLPSLAAVTLSLARYETTATPLLLAAETAGALLVPLTVGRWIGRWSAGRKDRRWCVAALIGGWSASAWMVEVLLRSAGWGDAWETTALVSWQNATLAWAAVAMEPRATRSVVLLSSFLVLFAAVIGTQPLTFCAAGLYGVCSLWWLMARYWERLQRAHTACEVSSLLGIRSAWYLAALAVAGVVAATLATWQPSTTYALAGWFPSSGGERWSDPHARAGVGDGEALVAARERALSFGPVESELFLESQMPSLYDIATEIYGRPPPPRGELERAIALDAGQVQHPTGRMSQTQQSGREFSAVRRRSPAAQRSLDRRDSPALLYVAGPVPLHLSLATYDTYDGERWTQTHPAARGPRPTLTQLGVPPRPWIEVGLPGQSPLFRGTVQHALKVINLQTPRVPAPPQLAAIHIDRLDNPDFFGRTADGQFVMTGRSAIPQLTVLHVRSRGLDLSPLRSTDFTASLGVPVADRGAAAPLSESLAAIAEQWTAGQPRGWRQVEAVVERLRTEFEHDESAVVPADGRSPIEHFLRNRRGPDYLFATTAAVLLREQGYGTRLVCGFYARPQRTDRRSGQTAVLSRDLHTWAEVQVEADLWVPIEPTPGFAAPPECWTWRQRLAEVAAVVGRWLRQRWFPLLAGGSLLLLLIRTRAVWLDGFAQLVWLAARRGSPVHCIRWTLWLLEGRCRRAGYPRPAGTTISQWYGQFTLQQAPDRTAQLRRFLQLAERILYAGPLPAEGKEDHTAACVAALQLIDRRQIRAARTTSPRPATT
ncbi:MAG: transglutaminase-like domain-containing protein [Pirellulales bacterium]